MQTDAQLAARGIQHQRQKRRSSRTKMFELTV
jgi:hypothetical protein